MASDDSNVRRIQTNILSNIDRSSFIDLINGLMRGAVELDVSLSNMEKVLSDPTVFESLTDKSKIELYRTFMQRHNSVVTGINKVFDVAVRNDFNRNFFGIKSNDDESQIIDEENPNNPRMTKELSMLLAKISEKVNSLESKQKE